jgi:very-short-patch-repair endonuclease
MSQLEQAFLTLMRWNGVNIPKPETQYRFAKPRRFRFDFAWPEHRVAVEIEGGTWRNGRHTRGAGYARDCEKYNLAVVNGWRVLRYTSNMLLDDSGVQVFTDLQRLFDERE